MIRFLLVVLFSFCLAAQQMPPGPAGYTEARQYRVEGRLRLPASLESNLNSLVASEIAGLVVAYPVKEGDHVKKGRVLARLNQRDLELNLDAAKGQLEEAKARRQGAQRNFHRARALFDSKVFSQQQLDDTRYEFNAWQGRVVNLTAQIKRIQYDIQRSAIIAPFDGVVIKKRTQVGEWLHVGDPVVELLSLSELEVVADVPEQYYPTLRLGDPASVRFAAFAGRRFPGTISAIIPRANEEARTFPVKVRLRHGPARLGAGMIAQVELDGVGVSRGGSHLATVVPKDALVRKGTRLLVFLIGQDNTVKPVPVTTGVGVADWIEVIGSVRPGDRVVTRGNERLRPGQKVRGERVEYLLP